MISGSYRKSSKLNEVKYFFYASWPGALLTLVLIVGMFTYFTRLSIQMITRSKDTFRERLLYKEHEFNSFKILNEEFVPNIQIGALNNKEFEKIVKIVGNKFFNGNVT